MICQRSISAALDAVDEKKENLRKAFEDVEVRSSSLTRFTLQWKDIENHLDSIKRSLQVRFDNLEPASQPESDYYRAMKWFCINMYGVGLRSYIIKNLDNSKDDQVAAALASASDAPQLVLHAVQPFYPSQAHLSRNHDQLRRVCILLLQQLTAISPHIRPQIKTKALQLALVWKSKATFSRTNETFAFLQLIAAYRLQSSFKDDKDILDFAVSIASRKQAVGLIQSLDIRDKMPDFIRKLISNGKELDALKYVYAFELVDKFPPIPLLRAHIKQSIKAAHEIRENGKHSVQSLNAAEDKELSALRAVIKCVEEHNLESEYPRGTLNDRVVELVKRKANRKRPATIPMPVKKENQQQSTNKRPRPTAMGTSSSNSPRIHHSLEQQQPMSLGMPPYMSSPAQYGFAGTDPNVPYCPAVFYDMPPSYHPPFYPY